ncbi:alpha-(1,3)-fucosyltransferase c-like, partial [Plakobranchus ocellatus]
EPLDAHPELAKPFDSSKSPLMLPPGTDTTEKTYPKKKPEGNVKAKTIGVYDPKNEFSKNLMKTDFSECEYSKCKMVDKLETADAVIFLVARLTRITSLPASNFKRKKGQIWILKTDEAPSRFSWFTSLNRTGLKDRFNWTLTHKLDSDLPQVYGRLIKRNKIVPKNYDKIYRAKTRTAAWFVSHCPVRSRRQILVKQMQQRVDIDIYGNCGTLTCGQGAKVPGVFGMRLQADNETCLPMLSSKYKFYLAFENSLCQEYISEKFFKLFNDVDIIPVVRGGADYKSYFPPNMYVDASDFPSPVALADYLDDLGRDKARYINYLRKKNSYRMVLDKPDWQCKLCRKLHIDKKVRRYKNVHSWLTNNTCHDPMDSALFM